MIVPGSASPLLLSSAGGYNLTKSLRFRSSANAYLNRSVATSTASTKGTYSLWIKRGKDYDSTNNGTLISAANNYHYVQFYQQTLYFGGTTSYINTAAVFRDPAAWYHALFVFDTTLATSTDRLQIWVNGVRQTTGTFAVYPTINATFPFCNDIQSWYIGARPAGSDGYFDGYLAEINFIDGQALTPSSFGETSSTTGTWIPKKYSGTYGTNGFYLKFTDTTSTSTLGTDFSGNSNTWTVNNISLTAGSTYDSMTDVPTLTSATQANYCVMSPIASSPLISLTNGNLTAGGTDEASLIGTIGVNSGKWYWEVTVTSGSVTPYLGVGSNPYDKSGVGSNYLLAGISWYGNALKKAYTGTSSTSATSNTTGVYGFALDISAGTLAYYFNNSLVFTDTTIPTSGVTLFPLNVHTNSGSNSWNPANFNFGQQPFSYTPPTGFLQLNTFNLPTPTIGATASTQANQYMNVVLYSGNNSTQNIAVGFQPDWVWSKCRNVARSHRLSDAVRGSTRDLYSDTTNAEQNDGSITSFISTGFSLNNATGSTYNTSGENYVSWAWKANGAGVSNTAGSITSTVSANTTSGFSIVTYTGNGTASTVGHGLGATPGMIIIKCRSTAYNWAVWHTSLGGGDNALQLNTTIAVTSAFDYWNGANTSSVFTLGTDNGVNQSTQTYVAYCFAPIAGYSAFGSYTGNGSSDGTFVYTGFRPRFILVKNSSNAGYSWLIWDSVRETYNVEGSPLFPNLSNAEGSVDVTNYGIDFVSNGFKIRATGAAVNNSGHTYIYMAFAENPFKYANAR